MLFNIFAPLRNAIRPGSVLVNLDAFKQINVGTPERNGIICKIDEKYMDQIFNRQISSLNPRAKAAFESIIQGWISGDRVFKKPMVTAIFIQVWLLLLIFLW
jgi:hypothetical protein